MTLRFAKYHGIGNDFVVVEGPLMDAARAVRICDRRRGVGADGVLTILPPETPGAVARMHIYNSDGSVAAMCGNGIRCVAKDLVPRLRSASGGATPGTNGSDLEMVIDTDAGPKRCVAHLDAAGEAQAITVEMGPGKLLGEEDFTVGGERLRAVRVSMGNPHAVFFDAPTRERASAVGPLVEKAVPGGVNAGFSRPGADGIDLVVWERGAGLTEACGTGACAAAVAAVSRGLAPAGRPVEVRLPGGPLQITVAPDLASVRMRGPAALTYRGETEL
ncbi:MAG: diaminopimelate epimerase [Anaeromyxobacter sp.]